MSMLYIIILFLIFIVLITLLTILSPHEKINAEIPMKSEILESKCSESEIIYIKLKVKLLKDIDFSELKVKVTTKLTEKLYKVVLPISKKGETTIITLEKISDVQADKHKFIVEIYGKNYYEELEGYCGVG